MLTLDLSILRNKMHPRSVPAESSRAHCDTFGLFYSGMVKTGASLPTYAADLAAAVAEHRNEIVLLLNR